MYYDSGLAIQEYNKLKERGMTNSDGSQKAPTTRYIADSVIDGLGKWIVGNWQISVIALIALLVLIKD